MTSPPLIDFFMLIGQLCVAASPQSRASIVELPSGFRDRARVPRVASPDSDGAAHCDVTSVRNTAWRGIRNPLRRKRHDLDRGYFGKAGVVSRVASASATWPCIAGRALALPVGQLFERTVATGWKIRAGS